MKFKHLLCLLFVFSVSGCDSEIMEVNNANLMALKNREDYNKEYNEFCAKEVKNFINSKIKEEIKDGNMSYEDKIISFTKIYFLTEERKNRTCIRQYNDYFKQLTSKGYKISVKRKFDVSPYFRYIEWNDNNQVKEDDYFLISWDK